MIGDGKIRHLGLSVVQGRWKTILVMIVIAGASFVAGSLALPGPDLNLRTQRFVTSDDVSTDIPELQGTGVTVTFGFAPDFSRIFGCLLTFEVAPPAGSNVICRLTDQGGNTIAFGTVPADGAATEFAIQTNRDPAGNPMSPFVGIDIQEIDDVKVIVFNAQFR